MFDAHNLRPQSGMIVFEIARDSELDPADYEREFLTFSER